MAFNIKRIILTLRKQEMIVQHRGNHSSKPQGYMCNQLVDGLSRDSVLCQS